MKLRLLGPWIGLELEFREREKGRSQVIRGLQRTLQRKIGMDAKTSEVYSISGWRQCPGAWVSLLLLSSCPSREGLGGHRKPRLGIPVRELLRAEAIRKVRATAGL